MAAPSVAAGRHGVRLVLALLLSLGSLSCSGRTSAPPDAASNPPDVLTPDLPPPPERVDILFVISRDHEELSLTAAFLAQGLITDLLAKQIDFHLGLVSTTLPLHLRQGCGELTGNPALAHDGSLLYPLLPASWADKPDWHHGPWPPNWPYLGREHAALTDLLQLTRAYFVSNPSPLNCLIGQYLEVSKLALEKDQGGFFRSDALLLVVVLADTEDCSIADPALFEDPTWRQGMELSAVCYRPAPGVLHPLSRYETLFKQIASRQHFALRVVADDSPPVWAVSRDTQKEGVKVSPCSDMVMPAPRLVELVARLRASGRVDARLESMCALQRPGGKLLEALTADIHTRLAH